ncbi:chorismate mutase [Benzoatithermus flavus]|uniref:chorismate mutase n=1 Tax=Benzoatithermus flavus TaxID=3108223 RepID=A0ABU8XS40_9PROT
MAPPPDHEELENLRREVDRLDAAMVDLLAERMRVVQAIARIKQAATNGRPAIRPGREAVILRRLAERAAGRFPTAALLRMWRELLAATTRAQAPFTVAVQVPPDQPALWDVARDHFGSLTPMLRTESGSQALRLLAEDVSRLAVLPLPGEEHGWWISLLDTSVLPLRIVARLPFSNPGTYPEGVDGFVVGAIEPEPSGDDVSLIAVETVEDVSRARLLELLGAAGQAPRWLAGRRRSEAGHALHLLELDGFPMPHDPRLDHVLAHAREHVLRCVWLGGYARPLPVGEGV